MPSRNFTAADFHIGNLITISAPGGDVPATIGNARGRVDKINRVTLDVTFAIKVGVNEDNPRADHYEDITCTVYPEQVGEIIRDIQEDGTGTLIKRAWCIGCALNKPCQQDPVSGGWWCDVCRQFNKWIKPIPFVNTAQPEPAHRVILTGYLAYLAQEGVALGKPNRGALMPLNKQELDALLDGYVYGNK